MNSNILIVDDEPSVLKLLKDILTAEAYRVRPFNNGELALRSAEAEAPELVLVDIRMPGMNGFEFCRRLKENPKLKEIPVIFISAATDMEDKVKAFQMGGVDYITKPFQKEEVIARINTHVMLSHAMQETKRIAEALHKSELSLKIAQAMAHLGHWEWDVNAGQFDWSEETYRIFGFEPKKLSASYEAFLQIIHPDDRDRVADCLKQALAGNGFDIEYRIILPDGAVRVVHGKGQVVHLDDEQKPKLLGTVQYFSHHDPATLLGVIQDITEHKKLERQLERQANTDFLTGCASRRFFLDQARQEVSRIRRYGGELSVLMLDLDHFKRVNDQYGHHIGDLTLKKMAEVCHELLREVDVMGRLGGEEFAIMLPETDSQQALEIAQRLCDAVASAEVRVPSGAPIRFTTSVGVARFENDDQIETVLDRADQALYKAKREGRNRVC